MQTLMRRGSVAPTKILMAYFVNFSLNELPLPRVTQEDVEAVAKLLNRRPRKCLGWKTPEEVFLHKVLHLT